MSDQRCTRCVMSSKGDSKIQFDENGVCNYCKTAQIELQNHYFPNETGKKHLEEMFDRIKKEKRNEKYDCMIGLSGGLDSSYLAYLAYQYGLRMLAVHIDDGFDTQITKNNIQKICDKFHIDLITECPNKEQYADLIKAFIRAGVPDIAIPQDNSLFAALYRYAEENKIEYFLSGSNFALESILQEGNSYDASDKVHIKDIHRRYGEIKLDQNFPLISTFEKRIKYGKIYRIKTLKPLNYVEYNAADAMKELQEACGFEYYGDKHCESIFTRFMQRYYLPQKFNVDKRTSHYSSLIMSGQITRKEAIEKLHEPLYTPDSLEQDKQYVLEYLQLNENEFDRIMKEEPRSHDAYKKSLINRVVQVLVKIRTH